MMWTRAVVALLLLSCCLCLENDVAVDEARARKKGSSKLVGLLVLLAVAKVVILKAVSLVLMTKVFQKLFMIGGVLLKYFLSGRGQGRRPAHHESPPEGYSYDTVGYSYGPEHSHEPAAPDVVTNFGRLINKHL